MEEDSGTLSQPETVYHNQTKSQIRLRDFHVRNKDNNRIPFGWKENATSV